MLTNWIPLKNKRIYYYFFFFRKIGSTSVRRMDVVLGDDVTLDCDLEDARIVEWSGWTQRAGPILMTTNSTSSLSLQGISIEDEGLYRCVSKAPDNNKSILGTFIHLHVQGIKIKILTFVLSIFIEFFVLLLT